MQKLPALLRLVMLQLLLVVTAIAAPNPQEAELGDYLVNASGQNRPFLKYDPLLNEVARRRAEDMARRDYFSHVDPDGKGPNYHVEEAGYELPANWPDSDSANYIESIAAGRPSADATWSDFMGSAPHKKHLLAEDPFYQTQTSYGIGYAYNAGSQYRHYWVVITAPPRPVPALKIASPAANARVKTSAVDVSGTTSGPGAPQQVVARVENATGISTFAAAEGISTWHISLSGLKPGVNVIRVRSLNATGGVIAEATRKIRYVVLAPLTVAIQGGGTVTAGFLGQTQRQLGARYTVVAKPAAGYLFNGWTGDLTGSTPTVSFTMPEALSLVANFVPNPFPAHKGAYSGLLVSEDVSTGGLVSATLTPSGRISGKLKIGSAAYPFLAQLGLDGTASVTVRRANQTPVTLQLALDLVAGGLTVTATDGTVNLSSQADRLATKARLTVRPGNYAVSMPVDQATADGTAPAGEGFGTVRVNRRGLARVVGILADGQRFTNAGAVTEEGRVAVYSDLYANRGFVAGELQFRTTESSDVDGLLNWRKAPQSSDPLYPDGFATTIPVVGSLTPSPAKAPR